mmetsp:Transcript_30581/g.79786  ORF Transcript_30581/g.79786 Transcript_30581/m.79786 type:complete len:700 (-) Transcript_30581:2328-4427(-)
MSGWDQGGVFVGGIATQRDGLEEGDRLAQARSDFARFVSGYKEDTQFIYREQLELRCSNSEYFLEVALEDLKSFDPALEEALVTRPAEYLPIFEEAVQKCAVDYLSEGNTDISFQVTLTRRSGASLKMRDINSSHVSQLVHVQGIVTAASRTRSKATRLALRCKDCKSIKFINCRSGFGGAQIPRSCDYTPLPTEKKCAVDPFVFATDRSAFIDQQTLKLQESLDDVPTGEMPRHLLLCTDRYLVNSAVPGARVSIVGVYSIFSSAPKGLKANAAIRAPYINVLGMWEDREGGRDETFTNEEVEDFRREADKPWRARYEEVGKQIASPIFGHADIKRALACLLFGGSRKVLPEGMRIRGDINVLLLGDPSTAKSQLLKFVEKVAPISVYTSGKGSSAAGLTASVVRDGGSRDFYLEGGAMVLADGGVVCIDEFDKMREADRVAIHEAMEQQTISVAKAGITTILNSRTAVLAAANPVFGRFDDVKTAAENIDFQTTILSRFDLIFIVRDRQDVENDKRLAKHILSLHKQGGRVTDDEEQKKEMEFLRKYIAFARKTISPVLSSSAATKLARHYCSARAEARGDTRQEDAGSRGATGSNENAIPITVRQLEAIVRLSESIAKICLMSEVTEEMVDEAYRLFQTATVDAIKHGQVSFLNDEVREEILKVMDRIHSHVPVESRISRELLFQQLRKVGSSRVA